VIDEYPSEVLSILVVWEPVLPTDVAPPTTTALGLVHDPRAIQYWDAGRSLSADIVRSMTASPGRYGVDEHELGADTVVWDAVAVFPAGALWERDLPVPAFMDFPVVHSVDGLRASLASLVRNGSDTLSAPAAFP
jgi:hypothetical protein